MISRAVTIGKEKGYNEDAVLATDSLIAVSDGAGGGGLFADKWSQFLLRKLPHEPIISFEYFDKWVDGIWEEFYSAQEVEAKKLDALALDKFYSEGAFATIAAIWTHNNCIQWLTYGDSAVFCYDYRSRELICSVDCLSEFNKPPYLVSTNEPLNPSGFKCGTFPLSSSKLYFCASDALSFYILSSYQIWKDGDRESSVNEVMASHTKNSNLISNLLSKKRNDFESEVLSKLQSAARNRHNFELHLRRLNKEEILASDDYSICFMSM